MRAYQTLFALVAAKRMQETLTVKEEPRMNTYAKVLEIIENNVSGKQAVEPEKTLEALGIDSLDRVEISIDLEEHFRIDLEADTVTAWATVQDIINSVENETTPAPGKVMHVDAIPNDAASVAEYRDPLIPGGNIKHYSDAELKLAVSQQYGKPEAINRISRADLGNFKDNISHDEFAPPNALDDYQRIAVKSAIYPGKGTPFGAMYCALGLGEAGEIQNKVKKAFRDDNAVFEVDVLPSGDRIMRFNSITPERRTQIIKEMGGNLWYLAALADELGITLSEVAAANLTELCDRGERNTLRGDGDNR